MKRVVIGVLTLAGILGTTAGFAADAKKSAIEPKADEILKKMCTYLGGLKQFTVQGEEIFDEVLDNGQKLQFSHQRKVAISRPGNVSSEFKGDMADRVVYFNGSAMTMYDKDKNVYGTLKFKGSIDGLIDMLHEKLGFTVPLSDLLGAAPYKVLTREVTSGSYLGIHNVGGVKCHHLVFTQRLVDWQIWIETGDKPLPRKLVITQKQLRGEPQFTAVLSKWDTAPKLTDAAFTFSPPKGARQIDFLKLQAVEKKGKE